MRYPTNKELDEVAADRPVQIMHSSGHCNVCNTYLLERIGAFDTMEDPSGGAFGRDEHGVPNGPLFDSANDLLSGQAGVRPGNHGPNIHMPDNEKNLLKQLDVGQDYFLKAGITSVNEVQLTKQELNTYLTAQKNGLLKMRVEMSWLSNYLDEVIDLGFNGDFGDDQLSVGSIKLYSDASLLSGTAHLSSGYKDSDRSKGYRYHEEQEMIDLIVKAHKAGFQTLTHAQGDLAIQTVLDAVEQAQKECPRPDARHRIEHCGLPTEAQCRKMAELNVWAVIQVEMNYLYGDGVVSGTGLEIGSNFSPMGWFKKYGVNWTLSSDAPVTTPNPMEAIHASVTRKTILGNVIGDMHAVSVEEAMKAYTIDAAGAVRKEEKVGSIEPGKLADFAILDTNPLSLPDTDFDRLREISVMETWIGGEKVYEK